MSEPRTFPGDGRFHWYHTRDEKDGYASPWPTREKAILEGRKFHGPETRFFIFEADHARINFEIFWEPHDVLDLIGKKNQEIWGDDEEGFSPRVDPEMMRHLGSMLNHALIRWWDRYHPTDALAFGEIRNRETIEPLTDVQYIEVPCKACGGSGEIVVPWLGPKPFPCRDCKGRGSTRHLQLDQVAA